MVPSQLKPMILCFNLLSLRWFCSLNLFMLLPCIPLSVLNIQVMEHIDHYSGKWSQTRKFSIILMISRNMGLFCILLPGRIHKRKIGIFYRLLDKCLKLFCLPRKHLTFFPLCYMSWDSLVDLLPFLWLYNCLGKHKIVLVIG